MDNTQTPNDTLRGVVERITYFNAENGYSVLKILPDGKPRFDATARDGTVAVVGSLPELNVGETVEFGGQWKEDPKWGLQFRAMQVKPTLPTSERGITRYLEDAVKHIGSKTAEKIVDAFGAETLDVLNNDPARIYEVDGVSDKQAQSLISTWRKNHDERRVIIFLQEYGVTIRFARRIYEEYGQETIQLVNENPYRLADDLFGVGFIKADAVAQEMGMKLDSTERISAGLSYALRKLASNGHTYAPRPVLVETTAELLGLQDLEHIDMVVTQRVRQDLIYQENLLVDDETVEAIYLPVYYHSERGCERLLRQMMGTPSVLERALPRDQTVQGYVEKVVADGDIQLTKQQTEAVRAVLTNKLTVLTGGPGTGKTTTLDMVLQAAQGLNVTTALAAPTGRAAKRLGEATGMPASTIHRLLSIQPGGGFNFEYGEDNPLDVDLLVLDETSMLDLFLFYNVLQALPPKAHLMLVGDVDQLPSVGAGNVLRDVIHSGIAHVTRLSAIFRQDERSHIVANAHKINTGREPYLGNSESDDFYFFRTQDAQAAADMLVDVVTNRVPQKFGYNPMEDIQVLAPMYRGPVGVNALNRALQARLNGSPHLAEVTFNGQVFRRGDKIMQTRNNYDKNVFNGDSGRIHSINAAGSEVDVIIDDRLHTYTFAELEELVLAYCISTHRSQGSEYPVVVMPVHMQHYVMLQRNLLYTAITRARKLVVLVGEERAVRKAVKNDEVSERFSGLCPRLQRLNDAPLFNDLS